MKSGSQLKEEVLSSALDSFLEQKDVAFYIPQMDEIVQITVGGWVNIIWFNPPIFMDAKKVKELVKYGSLIHLGDI